MLTVLTAALSVICTLGYCYVTSMHTMRTITHLRRRTTSNRALQGQQAFFAGLNGLVLHAGNGKLAISSYSQQQSNYGFGAVF